MSAAILSLGTELTRGEVENSNATWLADRLTDLNHEVTEIVTVDDDDDRIDAALRRLAREHGVIVCTGGLGPTTDDRTSASVARVLGVPLALHPVARANVEAALARRGRTLGPDNDKQAHVPEGATILMNPVGTAPGFAVALNGDGAEGSSPARAFFLPGVPSEMRAMFKEQVVPSLPAPEALLHVRHLRTAGMPESELGQRLDGIEARYGVTIGYRASVGGVAIKVLARSSPSAAAEADERVGGAWSEIIERLGPAVYSTSSAPLERVLGELLRARALSVAVAESCTAGGVSELLARVPGASAYFHGGIVAYDNRVKVHLLGVPQTLLDAHGAVSPEVAKAMATGACRALDADVGISVTGIAGPDGGSEEKPVGLVHWAVALGDETRTERVEAFQARFSGSRSEVQRRAATAALFAAWKVVRNEPET